MSKGKFQKKGSKILVLMLAMMLVFGMAVGGTLAYLMDTSEEVTNTFTVGDIDIELKEHSLVNGNLSENEVTANIANTYKVLPGTTQPKDPFVRFVKDSEACWLFVKITETNNTVSNKTYKYVTYDVDTPAWTEVATGVYGRKLTAAEAKKDTEYKILRNNEVTYNENLTKGELTVANTNKPVLTFQAYAIQSEGLKLNGVDVTTAADAWTVLNAG